MGKRVLIKVILELPSLMIRGLLLVVGVAMNIMRRR